MGSGRSRPRVAIVWYLRLFRDAPSRSQLSVLSARRQHERLQELPAFLRTSVGQDEQ